MMDETYRDEKKKHIEKIILWHLERQSKTILGPSNATLAKILAEEMCIMLTSVGDVIDEKLKDVASNFDKTREWVDNTTTLLVVLRKRILTMGDELKELEERINRLEKKNE